MSDEILVATESFSTEIDGEHYVAVKGQTRVRASHPLAQSNPQYFEAAAHALSYDIEQATAAPGEKRAGIFGRKPKAGDPDPQSLDDMGFPQLLQEAAKDGIDVPKSVKSKLALRALIAEHRAAAESPANDEGGESTEDTPNEDA